MPFVVLAVVLIILVPVLVLVILVLILVVLVLILVLILVFHVRFLRCFVLRYHRYRSIPPFFRIYPLL